MEHIIIVRVESDRPITELVSEIQSNLEYEDITSETFEAPESLRRAVKAERRTQTERV